MVLVFGAIGLEVLYALEELPRPDETLYVRGAMIHAGGKGANQAVAAARDRATVAMVGAVGEDVLAEVALAGLREAGVNLGRVRRVPFATGISSICRDTRQQAHIVTASGANLHARAEWVEDAALRPGTVLLAQMDVDRAELATLVVRARDHGATVVLNMSPPGMIDTEALRAASVVVLDEGDSGWLSVHLGAGVGAGSLRAALGVPVVRTLGVSGVECADAAGHLHLPATPAREVDRTGAQDCFVGVLAAALERGLPLREAVARANVAASLSTRALGIQRSLPDKATIDAAIEHGLRGRLQALSG